MSYVETKNHEDIGHSPLRCVKPSTDAERSAFVKDIARTALALGVKDDCTLRERAARRITDGKSKTPKAAPATDDDVAAATSGLWYRIEIDLCGDMRVVCVHAAKSPKHTLHHVRLCGLCLLEQDGSCEWFDPASISRVRVDRGIGPCTSSLRHVDWDDRPAGGVA